MENKCNYCSENPVIFSQEPSYFCSEECEDNYKSFNELIKPWKNDDLSFLIELGIPYEMKKYYDLTLENFDQISANDLIIRLMEHYQNDYFKWMRMQQDKPCFFNGINPQELANEIFPDRENFMINSYNILNSMQSRLISMTFSNIDWFKNIRIKLYFLGQKCTSTNNNYQWTTTNNYKWIATNNHK